MLQMQLSDAEFEDAYAEALLCLVDDGYAVGKPFCDGTGARYCTVEKHCLNDKDILELWWGKDIARRILEGRPATVQSVQI
jgi:hypothetical protein